MQSFSKKRGLTEKRQAWIDTLETKPNLRQSLTSFASRGLATQDQVEQLSGLTTKQVRGALDELLKGFYGNVPLLRSETVHLQGRRGRPQVVYILTLDGAAVLSALLPEETLSAPKVEDPVELAHALMEMEVYILARRAGFAGSIEHVLRFEGKHSIRADVLVKDTQGSQVIFEMEQTARPGDVPRILNKLKQYIQFFRSTGSQGVCSDIRILFNLASEDTTTIKRWSLVLAELQKQEGSLPFRLFWQPVLFFLQSPEWASLEAFEEIPFAASQETSQSSPEETPSALQPVLEGSLAVVNHALLPPLLQTYQPADLSSLNLILHSLAADNTGQPRDLIFPQPGREDFFDLVRTIYQVSHYEEGPVQKQAALPVLSIWLLYRYLNMHQNQALLQAVLRGREEVRKSLNRGINLFRDAYSRLCWTFLRYHGFGRGGPLEVSVRVPALNGDQSEIMVEVRILDPELIIGRDGLVIPGDLNLTQEALSWMLSAIWLYGEELGLVPRPFKKGKE